MAVPFATETIGLNDVRIIGGSLANPATGAGVAAPVGSRLLGSSGRQWLKQAAADTAWKPLLIRSQFFNVLDYGAVGDDVTDNRVAINAAITAASAAGGGVVYFPPGTYAVYKTGAGAIASFDLNGSAYNNITFLGSGNASIVHMAGNAFNGDWYLFYLRDTVKRVTFKNLAFTGVGVTNPDPAEQNHAIQISNLLTDNAYTGNVLITDCRFHRFVGDGVRVLGNGATRLVRDVLVKRCAFTMRDPGSGLGSRSGVAYQRGTFGVNVINCYLTGSDDQEVDMESTSTIAMGQNAIDGNHIDHDANGNAGMTLTGTGVGRHSRSVVSRNTILDGSIQGLNVQQSVLTGNMVSLNNHPASGGGALDLQERIDGNVFSGNQFYVGASMLNTAAALVFTEGSGRDNHHSVIDGNLMVSLISQGAIVTLESQAEMHFRRNMVRVAAARGGGGDTSVSIRSITDNGRAEVVEECMVRDTTGTRFYGITFSAAPGDKGAIIANDSLVVGSTIAAINFSSGGGGSTFDGPIIGNGNIGNPAGTDPVVYPGSNATASVDGNGGSSALGVNQLIVTPEGARVARPGSLAMRIVGGGDGLTMYVKDDAAVDASGWSNVGVPELVFGALSLGTATGSLYLAPGIALAVVSATQFNIVAARDMVVRAIRVKQIAGTGGGNTEYRLMKNGATTANTVTVAFTATAGNANVAINFAAGDRIAVRTSKSVAAATAPTYAVVTLEYFFR